jgi:hypothetical protein
MSELEDKIEIKDKTEEILVKQLKSSERNMQELSNSIKRSNLRITGINEGEELQDKGISNMFKIFQILRKFCPFRYRNPPENQINLTKTEPPHSILSLKQ